MEKFKSLILTESSENVIHKELQYIFRCEGNFAKVSGSQLRKAIGSPFSHGTQQDAIEFLDTLLGKLPFVVELDNLLNYELTIQRTFQGPRSPACHYCSMVEDPVLQVERTINLHLPHANSLVLQNLIDRHFDFSANFKRCSKCPSPTSLQPYQETKGFSPFGSYLFIHLMRFDSRMQKINSMVHGSFIINIQDNAYKLIAILNHHGLLRNSGHYTAFLEKGDKWYLCDDDKVPSEISKDSGITH